MPKVTIHGKSENSSFCWMIFLIKCLVLDDQLVMSVPWLSPKDLQAISDSASMSPQCIQELQVTLRWVFHCEQALELSCRQDYTEEAKHSCWIDLHLLLHTVCP
ncbi:hypothetical protein QQP08_018093 [Theobroma cacao]|nr:hypothetical protein QQP08_016184 [Theobroma cacao]WRX25606.1 hypothetical protein QQP08_018093 [Theobroma cacao]